MVKWWDAQAIRYGIQGAVAITVAIFAYQALHLSFGYWVPLSTALVLKLSAGASIKRSWERFLGTIVGVLLCFPLLNYMLYEHPNPFYYLPVLIFLLPFVGRYSYFGSMLVAMPFMVSAVAIFFPQGMGSDVDAIHFLWWRVADVGLGVFIAFVSILVVFPNLHFGRRNEQFRNFFKAFADHLTELSQCGPIEALQKTEAAVAGSLNQLNTQLEELRYEPMHLILNDEKDSKVLEECNRIYQALILVRHFYEHRGHSIAEMKIAIGKWLLSYADYFRALAIGETPKIKLEALAQQLNELHALLRTPEQINADLNGMIRTSAVISALSELVWDQENAPV